MDQVMIKGFIIGNVLDLVRGTMSASDFAALEEELGLSYKALKLSYFKDYPVELQIRAEEKVAQILWQRSDDGAFYKFGRLNFEAFAKTAIGRTALALVGKDPKRLVKASIRLMSTVMKVPPEVLHSECSRRVTPVVTVPILESKLRTGRW